MDIFEKIRKIRKDKRLSQKYVAEIIGITQPAYAKIENPADPESGKISIDIGVSIAKALGVSFNELFDIEATIDKESTKDEIIKLKQEIESLKEQLNDKRKIIEFLSKNDLLLDAALRFYYIEHPEKKHQMYDLNDLESLIKDMKEKPYDRDDKESMIRYISKFLK